MRTGSPHQKAARRRGLDVCLLRAILQRVAWFKFLLAEAFRTSGRSGKSTEPQITQEYWAMTFGEPVCDHRNVHRRPLLISIVCLILAIVRTSGVHAHLSMDHAHDATSSAHDTLVHTVVYEHDAGHLDSHLEHGDVDVDVAAKGFSKFSSLSLPVALVAFVVLLFLTTFSTSLQRSPPPSRPPKWRRRAYLTPPSQAPPALA